MLRFCCFRELDGRSAFHHHVEEADVCNFISTTFGSTNERIVERSYRDERAKGDRLLGIKGLRF